MSCICIHVETVQGADSLHIPSYPSEAWRKWPNSVRLLNFLFASNIIYVHVLILTEDIAERFSAFKTILEIKITLYCDSNLYIF